MLRFVCFSLVLIHAAAIEDFTKLCLDQASNYPKPCMRFGDCCMAECEARNLGREISCAFRNGWIVQEKTRCHCIPLHPGSASVTTPLTTTMAKEEPEPIPDEMENDAHDQNGIEATESKMLDTPSDDTPSDRDVQAEHDAAEMAATTTGQSMAGDTEAAVSGQLVFRPSHMLIMCSFFYIFM